MTKISYADYLNSDRNEQIDMNDAESVMIESFAAFALNDKKRSDKLYLRAIELLNFDHESADNLSCECEEIGYNRAIELANKYNIEHMSQ